MNKTTIERTILIALSWMFFGLFFLVGFGLTWFKPLETDLVSIFGVKVSTFRIKLSCGPISSKSKKKIRFMLIFSHKSHLKFWTYFIGRFNFDHWHIIAGWLVSNFCAGFSFGHFYLPFNQKFQQLARANQNHHKRHEKHQHVFANEESIDFFFGQCGLTRSGTIFGRYRLKAGYHWIRDRQCNQPDGEQTQDRQAYFVFCAGSFFRICYFNASFNAQCRYFNILVYIFTH